MEYEEIKKITECSWQALNANYPEKEDFIKRHHADAIDKLAQYLKMLDDNDYLQNSETIAENVKTEINDPYIWGISIDVLLDDPKFNDLVAMQITVPTLDPEECHDATTAFEGQYFNQLMDVMRILNMKWSNYATKEYDCIKYRIAQNVCDHWSDESDLDSIVDFSNAWVKSIVDFGKLRNDLFDRCRQMINKKIGPCPTKISNGLTVDLRHDVIESLYHNLFYYPQTFDFFSDVIDIAKGKDSYNIKSARKTAEEAFDQRYL